MEYYKMDKFQRFDFDLTKLTETMNMSFTASPQYNIVRFYSTPESNLTTNQVKYLIDAFAETLFCKYGETNGFSTFLKYPETDSEPNLLCTLRIIFA